MDNLLRQRSLAASTGKVEYNECVCVYTCNDVREERQEGEREGGRGGRKGEGVREGGGERERERGRGSEGERGRGGEGGGERERGCERMYILYTFFTSFYFAL